MPHDWRAVAVEWQDGARGGSVPMRWYGEYLWRASVPAAAAAGTLRVCATDAAGNRACSDRQPGPAGAPPAGGRAGR
jgi:hypothetical protein